MLFSHGGNFNDYVDHHVNTTVTISFRLSHSIWQRCTMPGIFVDIYFLKASTLSYLMPLVSTLTAGALSCQSELRTLQMYDF